MSPLTFFSPLLFHQPLLIHRPLSASVPWSIQTLGHPVTSDRREYQQKHTHENLLQRSAAVQPEYRSTCECVNITKHLTTSSASVAKQFTRTRAYRHLESQNTFHEWRDEVAAGFQTNSFVVDTLIQAPVVWRFFTSSVELIRLIILHKNHGC